MKYIEYVWLGWALVLMGFLATNFGSDDMKGYQYVIAFLGIVISTFMFTFRRNLRKQVDRRLAEEEEGYDEEDATPEQEDEIIQ